MHPTPTFRLDDKEQSLAFVDAHPFAQLAVNGDNGPVTALAPLVLDASECALLGHVARANPFWKAAKISRKAVAVFRSVDGYISPSSYASKKEHGRAVPTWNYIAVEIRGEILVETDPSAMEPFLQALTFKMETPLDDPWQISDAPKDYIQKLSHGIVGFKLDIGKITHVRKLSQNKSEADKIGILKFLEYSGSQTDKALANAMNE